MPSYMFRTIKSCWILMLAAFMLAGCTTMGDVKDVSSPPRGFNPRMRGVCHNDTPVAIADIPASFLLNKPKVILLVKLQSLTSLETVSGKSTNWILFKPTITVNDKVKFFLTPKQSEPIQIKAVEIDASDLKPGINTFRISPGWDNMGAECSGSCCPIGIGLAFQDDPSIPLI